MPRTIDFPNSLAQAQSIGTLCEQIGHVQKSEAHALGCKLRGESSQWSSNLPQTYRIVPAWDTQWNFEEMEAMWDCASQLWVPGRSRVHGRPYLSFCPITLQRFSFRSWWVCRRAPIWKRSRLVPFLFGWGHWKGGLGGKGVRWVSPKIIHAYPTFLFWRLLLYDRIFGKIPAINTVGIYTMYMYGSGQP